MERDYFRSIYFREPGGVLFELATDIPGFAIDEPVESLGEQLRVPNWLEPHLAVMTRHLPPVTLHKRKGGGAVVTSDPHANGRVLHCRLCRQ